jgi:hypothetical protein
LFTEVGHLSRGAPRVYGRRAARGSSARRPASDAQAEQ